MPEIHFTDRIEMEDFVFRMGARVIEIEQVLRRNDQPGDRWESYEPTGEVIVHLRDV